MSFIADLHIHSRFSRATSKQLDVPTLHAWARRKGIGLLGTGDCIHPAWLPELKEHLEEAGDGLLRPKADLLRAADADVPAACEGSPRFVLQTEISNIYKAGDRVRKVHNLIILPDFAAAERLASRLDAIGNIRSDGRPILGLDSRDLLEIALEADPRTIFIPAHIWTPWFSALGSKSGFDSIEECYRDLTPHIHAVETGLSSDPPMNWRVSSLDRFVLVSNSDAHSPSKLGREANLLSCPRTYEGLRAALETGHGLDGTLEFYPEEGKYHLDGHRKCGVCLEPEETRTLPDGRCPTCGRKLTVGVLSRVVDLADRPLGVRGGKARDFESLVSLDTVIGEVLGRGPATKGVQAVYASMLEELGPELEILRDRPLEDIRRCGPADLDEAIRRIRAREIHAVGGYDGEYGTVRVFREGERDAKLKGRGPGLFGAANKAAAQRGDDTATVASCALRAWSRLGSATATATATARATPACNQEQQEAVHLDHPVIAVIAGPGTGKTRVLTERVARLLADRVDPASILVVTFTRKAAGELRARLALSLTEEAAAALSIETFHSLALRILSDLSERELRVADAADRVLLLESLWRDYAPSARVRKALAAWVAGEGDRPEGIPTPLHDLKDRYHRSLDANGLVDLAVVIPRAVEALGAVSPGTGLCYGQLLVDEFQDIDPTQLDLLDSLRGPDAAVFVIGDPDQSIYRFRGADPTCFERLARWGMPRTLGLRRNYRSAATVRRIAGMLLGRDPGSGTDGSDGDAPGPEVRLAALATEAAEAEYVAHSIERLVGGTSNFSFNSDRVETDEGEEIGFGDVAVLARTASALDATEVALLRLGLPVQRPGRADDEVEALRRDLSALVAAAANPEDRLAYARLEAAAGDGSAIQRAVRLREAVAGGRAPADAAWEILGGADPAQPRRSAWDVLRPALPSGSVDFAELSYALATLSEAEGMVPGDRVALLTLHASKGLEFDVVFICGLEEGLLPHERAEGPDGVDEERRLLYVGLTRARSRLHLCRARRRVRFGRAQETQPSRFLADVERALVTDELPGSPGRRRTSGPVQKTLL